MPNYRSVLGRPLTAEEFDANTQEFADAIADLISNRPTANSIVSATISGTALTFYMTDGSTVGPITIPILRFRWRGDWAPSEIYAELDAFKVDGYGIYSVNIAHTSGSVFDPDLLSGGNPVYFALFTVMDLGSIADLTDVTITSIADDDFLAYDLATLQWTNRTKADTAALLIPNAVVGDASGFKIARSASPVTLAGTNPTTVASGLTTIVAVFVQLVGSVTPGDSTSVLTVVISGTDIDIYAWMNTGGTDPTLVESTGTETFNWFAIGT